TSERTCVLVVGGGPVGLSAAALLGRFGLPVVLVERRAGVNPHPRARSVTVRTGEIFRRLGVLEAIEAVSLPRPWGEQFVYTETLAGREIGRMRMHVQPIAADGTVWSPAPWLLSSQDQIEPIIARCAASQAGVSLRWGTELVSLDRSGGAGADRVRATVRSANGAESVIEASWVIAADGAASFVRRSLGVAMEGGKDLATLVNCHFRADLRRWTDHRPAALYWTTAPARNVFQKIDAGDRWLCQLGYDPREHAPEYFDRDTAAAWIRRSIGQDVELDVIDVIPWVMHATVAETMRVGRVFLAGDAAHQLPPSGGFGMSTGVQDVHNLAWKLAFVERGRAGDALLDTYDIERRPVARYNADRSMDNARAVGRIRRLMESGNAEDAAAAVAASARYGNWLGMDLGLHYEAGCLIPDGTEAPAVADPVSDYAPCARPGHRAPHHAITVDGATASTLDLFEDRFVVLAGPGAVVHGDGPDLSVRRIDDPTVLHTYGLSADGAVLVRPDGHVAWRQATGVAGLDAVGLVGRLTGVPSHR
ncbi:MAG: FAD-dependent monooxygenase, partial [Acidimicrobiales bacterium]|nr:FAD-dependent monooxygenase [Acidimicrobiales bacterium]